MAAVFVSISLVTGESRAPVAVSTVVVIAVVIVAVIAGGGTVAAEDTVLTTVVTVMADSRALRTVA